MNYLEIPSPIRYNHGKGDDRMKVFHNAVVYTAGNSTHVFAVNDGRFVAVGDEALALEGGTDRSGWGLCVRRVQ